MHQYLTWSYKLRRLSNPQTRVNFSDFSINRDGNFLPLFPSRQQPEHQMLVKKLVLLEAVDPFPPSSSIKKKVKT